MLGNFLRLTKLSGLLISFSPHTTLGGALLTGGNAAQGGTAQLGMQWDEDMNRLVRRPFQEPLKHPGSGVGDVMLQKAGPGESHGSHSPGDPS